MDQNIVAAANPRGYIVRAIEPGEKNQYGNCHIITIEGGQFRIVFQSNVLHGINYFQILNVTDYLINRKYVNWKYFHKFISLVSAINGDAYLNVKRTAGKI